VSAGPARLGGADARSGPDTSRANADLARRVIPFAVAAALPFLLTLLFGPNALSAGFVVAGALTALLTVLALTFPWSRVPEPWRATVPLSYYLVVFLLRNSSDTGAAV
jgi:hypothetical protein